MTSVDTSKSVQRVENPQLSFRDAILTLEKQPRNVYQQDYNAQNFDLNTVSWNINSNDIGSILDRRITGTFFVRVALQDTGMANAATASAVATDH